MTGRGRLLVCLVVPLALYFFLASRMIRAGVGLEYDEALYVESAVFVLHGGDTPPYMHDEASYLGALGRRWPLMIIPYVGAVRAYVALPLFAAFGVSAETARLSGVLLGGLGIAGLVTLLAVEVAPAAGLAAGTLLAIHPSYVDLTVFDNGGASVWMGAMGLGAVALVNHLRRRSLLSAGLLGLAAGLGVWGRANVLWLVAAAAAGALVAFGRRAIPPKRHLAAMALGGAIGAAPLAAYELASEFATFRFLSSARQPPSFDLVFQRAWHLAAMMISDQEQKQIWRGPLLHPWEVGIGAVLLGVAILGVLFPLRPKTEAIGRWRRAFSMTGLVLMAILLASRLNVRPHHLVAILPLAIAALSILGTELWPRRSKAFAALAIAAAGWAVLSLSWDVRIVRGLEKTGGLGVFSSGLTDVAAHLASNPTAPERLKILDWGFQSSLYVLSGGAVHGRELFWSATEAASTGGRTWKSEIRDGGSFLLFRAPSREPSPAARGFLRALDGYGGPRRVTEFKDRLGRPLAALVEIPAAP